MSSTRRLIAGLRELRRAEGTEGGRLNVLFVCTRGIRGNL